MNILRHQAFGQRQAGATLIIALMFLVIVTILGVGMFFMSSSDELVARNFRDREIALRSAEAAVNEAKLMIHGMYDRSRLPSKLPQQLNAETCGHSPLPRGFSCDRAAFTASTIDLFAAGTAGMASAASVGTYNPNGGAASHVSPPLAGLSEQPRYLIVLSNLDECSSERATGADGPADLRTCFKIFGQGRGRLANTRVNLVEMYVR